MTCAFDFPLDAGLAVFLEVGFFTGLAFLGVAFLTGTASFAGAGGFLGSFAGVLSFCFLAAPFLGSS
jgi:hypothetical protein